MAKTFMVHDLPSPKQLAPKSTPGDGSTYLAPAGTNGMGKPPKTPKAKAAPKAAKPNPTGNLVQQTKTLEKSSAMY
jgi:hypothetical protein